MLKIAESLNLKRLQKKAYKKKKKNNEKNAALVSQEIRQIKADFKEKYTINDEEEKRVKFRFNTNINKTAIPSKKRIDIDKSEHLTDCHTLNSP